MKSILIMAVTLFVLATTITNTALAKDSHEDESDIHQFIGLWEAIDPNDGGHQILSITDNGDGKVKWLLYDTFWTDCEGGRGVAQGKGKIEERHSLKSEDSALTCFNDVTPPEVESITFILNRDGTLTRESISDSKSFIFTYHRTSQKQ